MTAVEKLILAEANRRYVRKLVAQRGWTEEIEREGARRFALLVEASR